MKTKRIVWRAAKTVAIFLISVLVLSLLVFVVSRLAPGDPLVSFYGERAEKLKPAERAAAEARLGLDQPILRQYALWLKGALRGGAEFTLNGKMYPLAKNDGQNHLHGGLRGFDKYVWDAEILEDGVKFSRVSPDMEEGYPGNVAVSVTYQQHIQPLLMLHDIPPGFCPRAHSRSGRSIHTDPASRRDR